eukprot:jgi/Mesen1/1125/ME000123S00300
MSLLGAGDVQQLCIRNMSALLTKNPRAKYNIPFSIKFQRNILFRVATRSSLVSCEAKSFPTYIELPRRASFRPRDVIQWFTSRTKQNQNSPPRLAIVRRVPDSFEKCLTMTKPAIPIDVKKARRQHAAYVDVLKGLVEQVIEVPADERYPDCPFIEDTAVIIGNRAFITNPGAPERRGEVDAVAHVLHDLGLDVTRAASGHIDGGDVLHVGDHVFVGISGRTDEAGMKSLAAAFPNTQVVPIPVPAGGLHLKSVMAWMGGHMMAVEATPEGEMLFQGVTQKLAGIVPVHVTDRGAANVLLVGSTLLYSSALAHTSWALFEVARKRCVSLDMSEFHKADGGLTCLSLIVH